jgi:hypothetical protein
MAIVINIVRDGQRINLGTAVINTSNGQPLGDGRWGRVVGREGTERSVGRSHAIPHTMLALSTECLEGERH